jgi:hypothetical protein
VVWRDGTAAADLVGPALSNLSCAATLLTYLAKLVFHVSGASSVQIRPLIPNP